jgi:hypothetical protein
METERRHHARYPVENYAYAALGRDFSKVGQIKDISYGGLSLEYIDRKEKEQDVSQVNIFVKVDNIHIYNLACEVVYDFAVYLPSVNSEYFDRLTTRRCGIQFGPLSATSRAKLKTFIELQAIDAG